jgi:hypothetical protein
LASFCCIFSRMRFEMCRVLRSFLILCLQSSQHGCLISLCARKPIRKKEEFA